MNYNRDQLLESLLTEMQDSIPYADTRADIAIQQTSESSEIQDVIAHIRNMNGDIKWIEEGAIMAYTNNKVSFFQITDYLDENDDVLDYEVQLMKTDLNGVNVDVTDEIDIDDVRDMNNFFFKILIFMDPELVMFDPVYVDYDEINDRNKYFDTEDDNDYEYVDEYVYEKLSHVNEMMTWRGKMNETFILFEKEKGAELHILPPKTTGDDEYFNINKFNVDSIEKNGVEKMFQDMGFTITHKSKNKDIDYEMHAEPEKVIVYDIENSNREGDNIIVKEMLNTIEESTFHADTKALNEIKRKVKFNFKGKKRIKMQCRKGFKYVPERRVCVKITGSDMMNMKRQHIRASRTKKAAGIGFKNRVVRKTKKALRFRKNAGYQNKPFI